MKFVLVSLLFLFSCTNNVETNVTNNASKKQEEPAPSTSSDSQVLSIEDQADGNGSSINTLNIYKPTKLFAVIRDSSGAFVSNTSVSWSQTSNIGYFTNSNSSSTTFIPVEQTGTTTILADHETITDINIATTIDFSAISNISGISLWHRADALLNDLNDTDGVSDWEDSLNSANRTVQATLAYRPLFKLNGVNSLPSIDFNGTSHYLDTQRLLQDVVTSTSSTSFVVFSVHSIDTNSNTDGKAWFNDLVFGGGGSFYSLQLKSGGPAVYPNIYPGTPSSTSHNINYNQFYLVSLKHDGSTMSSKLNKSNLQSLSCGAITNMSYDNIYLGIEKHSGNLFDGEISELIMFNSALSNADLEVVEDYLCQKYALSCQ